MRVAVVGHVEWIDFVRVERAPQRGEIVHALDAWQSPGGGGAVAAVQLAKLAGDCTFFTALGDDALGRRAAAELGALGVTVRAAFKPSSQRRGITFIDAAGERTITVIGDRLAPDADDALPWNELGGADAVYVTAGAPEVIRLARRARVLVATTRTLPDLAASGAGLDAVVGSALDPSERYDDGDLSPPPRLCVRTEGAGGGAFSDRGAPPERYAPAAVPGPVVDTYGCGDSFAAGLTFALGRGDAAEQAVAFAARCGAAVAAGRGPYETQLRL